MQHANHKNFMKVLTSTTIAVIFFCRPLGILLQIWPLEEKFRFFIDGFAAFTTGDGKFWPDARIFDRE